MRLGGERPGSECLAGYASDHVDNLARVLAQLEACALLRGDPGLEALGVQRAMRVAALGREEALVVPGEERSSGMRAEPSRGYTTKHLSVLYLSRHSGRRRPERR